MTDQTHFDMVPLTIDPQTKAISSTTTSRTLTNETTTLNALARSLLAVETPTGVPPPPIPLNPKRGANVAKLRDSGNAEFRKGRFADAVKFYTLGLQMALQRPSWEPAQVVREEVAALFANRAQAHMALRQWAEGSVDAEASVEAKRVGNAKAWWRRGKCLAEMGRLEEARTWVGRALEVEGEEEDLSKLLREIEESVQRKSGGGGGEKKA